MRKKAHRLTFTAVLLLLARWPCFSLHRKQSVARISENVNTFLLGHKGIKQMSPLNFVKATGQMLNTVHELDWSAKLSSAANEASVEVPRL